MTDQTQTTQDTAINVSPTALEKIKGLITEKGVSETHALRVFVSGGGCSGMQYGMAFDDNLQETDLISEIDGVKIVIDPMSMQYLHGSHIDYEDSIMGGGFRIDNPNAVSSCGCGSSFRTKEDAGAGHSHAHSGGSCGCSH